MYDHPSNKTADILHQIDLRLRQCYRLAEEGFYVGHLIGKLRLKRREIGEEHQALLIRRGLETGTITGWMHPKGSFLKDK